MNALILLALATAPSPGPITSPSSWITYPAVAMQNGEQGDVGYELRVDATGKPVECRVVTSSRYANLDAETCRMILQRARFHPALGKAGQPVSSKYAGKVHYSLAE